MAKLLEADLFVKSASHELAAVPGLLGDLSAGALFALVVMASQQDSLQQSDRPGQCMALDIIIVYTLEAVPSSVCSPCNPTKSGAEECQSAAVVAVCR